MLEHKLGGSAALMEQLKKLGTADAVLADAQDEVEVLREMLVNTKLELEQTKEELLAYRDEGKSRPLCQTTLITRSA